MKKTEKERQALVDAIESGRYKTNSSAAVIALMIVVGFFFFLAMIMAAANQNTFKVFHFIVALLTMMPMIFPIAIIVIIIKLSKGADLSKLTALQRWLILNGEIIEADLEAIEQKGNLYIFRCSAEYKGDKWRFSSPAIGVQPIASEDRKIAVFVNPRDPNQNLVDIYSRLPLVGDNVLHDRSELQVDLNRKAPKDNASMVLFIICCIVFVPFGLIGLLFIGASIFLSGDISTGAVLGLMPLAISVLAIFGTYKLSKRNKSLWDTGYYIPATALKFWVTHSENNTTYHLSARYIEPSTKIAHQFQTTGPSTMKALVGSTVNVYIDPDNTRVYYIDVKTALKHLGFTTSREIGERK